MNLTPSKIRETYRASTPYQRQEIALNYIGQKVDWCLSYHSVQKIGDRIRVFLFGTDSGYLNEHITCEVLESDFSIIKVLPPGSLVQVVGVIGEVGEIGITLNDVSMRSLSGAVDEIYFPEGSREELFSFLRGKMLGAKDIKIFDPYLGDDILKLLEDSNKSESIFLLGDKIDTGFTQKTKGFKDYFQKKVFLRKTDKSHARFYIIDGDVYQVDSSLKNFKDKATTVHKINENSKKVKDDFNGWWDSAEIII